MDVTDRFVLPLLLLVTVTAGACADADDSRAPVDAAPIENPNYVQKAAFFGYITATTLSVRESPGTDGVVVGYVFKNDRIDIFESRDVGSGTWHRVTDAAGYIDGWVSGRFVSGRPPTPLPPPPTDYGEPRTPTIVTNVGARYVGTAACRRCHSLPGPGGFSQGAYGVWANHYHASAYQTLSRPYTRALAQQKRGIQDPATDWRCVKCHVSALGVPQSRLGPGYRAEDGVTCEVCHGPGGDYLLSHWEGQDGFESREAVGFRVYRDIEERDEVCRSCHNPLSPTYKPFNVASFSEAIRHWADEYEFREIASETEVATQTPRPMEEAPLPPADTVVSPPPVTNLVAAADDPIVTGGVVQPRRQAVAPRATPVRPPPREVPTADTTAAAGNDQPAPQVAMPDPPAPPPEPLGASRDEGPVDMVLDQSGERGRVPFPHHDHFEMVTPSGGGETCQVCHHTSEAGETPDRCSDCHLVEPTLDAPSAEKAYHGTCKVCHREEQAGPKKCSECHIR